MTMERILCLTLLRDDTSHGHINVQSYNQLLVGENHIIPYDFHECKVFITDVMDMIDRIK